MRSDELLRLVGKSLLAKMNSRTRRELTSTTGSLITWVRWGDAQEEVGFARNKFQEPFPRDFLLEKFMGLIRKNKLRNKLRFPVEGEVLAEKRNDPDFLIRLHSAAVSEAKVS